MQITVGVDREEPVAVVASNEGLGIPDQDFAAHLDRFRRGAAMLQTHAGLE